MSIATRCPACGTVFRVVRDQLKVSEGWVRCGRCSEVFNAGERLFELEQNRPPDAGPALAPAATSTSAARVGTPLAPPSPAMSPPATVHALAKAPAANDAAEAKPEARPKPVAVVPDANVMSAEALDAAVAPPVDAPVAAADTPTRSEDLDLRAEPTPGFVLRAERAERWRQPRRRGGMLAASLLLVATLLGQVALHFRDDLAAHWPAAQPTLQSLCGVLGCSVEPPRHIDSLAVDSSGLARVEGSELYRLSLVVRNRSSTPVRMPAVDLALTDAQGGTTARRVLLAGELGSGADSVPSRGDATLQGMLELEGQRIAGYTIELFYP